MQVPPSLEGTMRACMCVFVCVRESANNVEWEKCERECVCVCVCGVCVVVGMTASVLVVASLPYFSHIMFLHTNAGLLLKSSSSTVAKFFAASFKSVAVVEAATRVM